MSVENASLFSARHYRWLALFFAVVAFFASLVPLQYHPISLGTAISRFRSACGERVHFGSLSDWASNILLFIPLGYLLTAGFAVDRPRTRWLVGVVVVAVCAVFSACIEFTQLFFPPRVTSLNDIVAESLGAGLGVLAWLVVGQPLTTWVRRKDFGLAGSVFPVELLPCCVLALVLVELLPLDLSLQPGALYHKYKEGGVRLTSFRPWPGLTRFVERELENIFLFLPIGVLLSGLGGRWREWAGWRKVLIVGLVLVAAIKFLQLLVLSRQSVALDVLTYALAILLGWALGLAVRGYSLGQRGQSYGKEWKPRQVHFRIALLVWVVAIAFLNWLPFDFSREVSMAVGRLRQVSLLPFADYWGGNYFHAFEQIVNRLADYVPVGLILPPALGWRRDRSMAVRLLLVVAAWAILIEIGQAFLPSRYPSLTDVLVESLGAWLGYWCACRLANAEQIPELVGKVYGYCGLRP